MPFGLRLMRVNGHSMSPVLDPGDVVLVRQLSPKAAMPARGALVVARPAGLEAQAFIKRVVGRPGETICLADKQWALGEEECFLLGDNPECSLDSRVFGPVARRELVGAVVMRLWPCKRLSKSWSFDGFPTGVSSQNSDSLAEVPLAEAAGPKQPL